MQIFVSYLSLRVIPLEVESSDTIYSLKTMIENEEGIPRDKVRLIWLGKYAEDDRTLVDCGIREESVLYLTTGISGGGFSGHFVDLENKDALQRIAFTYGVGQSWCIVTSGLNIEGKCTQSSCTAYGKRVISGKQFCAFDITTDRSTCPLCDYTIKASSCGFADCEWMYSGRKRGSPDDITSEWQVTGDEYERFREAGNMSDWEVLIIRAKPNPSPRPECALCSRDIRWEQDQQSLECGCRFHWHCVASWRIRETRCPTCRVEIGTADISLEYNLDPPGC